MLGTVNIRFEKHLQVFLLIFEFEKLYLFFCFFLRFSMLGNFEIDDEFCKKQKRKRIRKELLFLRVKTPISSIIIQTIRGELND